eukprot:3151575-Pyramimonas_sp.AAC.1
MDGTWNEVPIACRRACSPLRPEPAAERSGIKYPGGNPIKVARSLAVKCRMPRPSARSNMLPL